MELNNYAALAYMIFLPVLFGAMAVFAALFFRKFIEWVGDIFGW